jgi:cytochrome c biogenesis protein ResB
MPEIAANLASAAWWFSAVVVALFINLLSAYAKPPIDEVWGRFSEKRMKKNAQKREELNRAVQKVATSAESVQLVVEDEIRHRLRSLTWLVFALIMVAQSLAVRLSAHQSGWSIEVAFVIFAHLASLLFFINSYRNWREVMRLTPIARAARLHRLASAKAVAP